MARFKYLGEPPYSAVLVMGDTTEIRLKNKDGSVTTLTPVAPATKFEINVDIGYDITEPRALRALRADTTRFLEI